MDLAERRDWAGLGVKHESRLTGGYSSHHVVDGSGEMTGAGPCILQNLIVKLGGSLRVESGLGHRRTSSGGKQLQRMLSKRKQIRDLGGLP